VLGVSAKREGRSPLKKARSLKRPAGGGSIPFLAATSNCFLRSRRFNFEFKNQLSPVGKF
jgi:hypothetical protein